MARPSNNINVEGNLTKDPELSYTPQQTAVCKFTLAVNRPRRNGEDQGADFPRITVWGKQAENCARYLSRGSKAAVLGELRTGSYKNKEGQTIFTVEIVADNVEFKTPKGQNSGEGHQQMSQEPNFGPDASAGAPVNTPPDTFQAAEDDIPF